MSDLRAAGWFAHDAGEGDVTLLGAPTSQLSISPSAAETTPAALRDALRRFPLWDADHEIDLSRHSARDAGDADMKGDAAAARNRLQVAAERELRECRLLAVCGGDNSITVPLVEALAGAHGAGLESGRVGLITLDAHHDFRPLDGGPSNGTPVRELVERGLPGGCVFQVGIGTFTNARAHSSAAAGAGVRWIRLDEMRARGVDAAVNEALRSVHCETLHLDVDLDVLDRAFAPATPASMPGGMSPAELVRCVWLMARDPRVRSIDLVEVDAAADPGGVTVRALGAALMTACAAALSR
jgi:arginase family enzyme